MFICISVMIVDTPEGKWDGILQHLKYWMADFDMIHKVKPENLRRKLCYVPAG
jgi:hypothetical protein